MVNGCRGLWTIVISKLTLAQCNSYNTGPVLLSAHGEKRKKPLTPLLIPKRYLTDLCVSLKNQGKLKGGRSTTASGFEYVEFLGIPYAKPPVGRLRFKSPQSPKSWQGVRDATSTDATNISLQRDPLSGGTKGSEDCLYLNVYTPSLPACSSKCRPVMVFIHGGGFVAGNGTLKSESGPDYLIEKDVVVVTINYRLGLLGFLNLGIPEAAGNMGLKDQIKALQWIQTNIDKFSGDKDNVTIFGLSSGSASCEFLMLNCRTKGLFHKCILQSGSTLNSWTMSNSRETRKIAGNLVRKLGCTVHDSNVQCIFKVLLEAPAAKITNLALQVVAEEYIQSLCFGFVPSVEIEFENREAFLIEPPYKILKEGRFNKVPVIRGFCNKEGMLICAMKPNLIKDVVKNKTFINYWTYTFDPCDANKYNSELKAAYVKNCNAEGEPDEFAVDFFGDLYIASGVYLASKLQCNHIPVYMYQFCYEGNLNRFKILMKLKRKGAGHSDEAGYILRLLGLSSQTPNNVDISMRNKLTSMWTNFAKTGNPTPECSDLPVQWPQFTEQCKAYLKMDDVFTIECDYEPQKMAIFEEIMDKYDR